jgi:hypothetical protein
MNILVVRHIRVPNQSKKTLGTEAEKEWNERKKETPIRVRYEWTHHLPRPPKKGDDDDVEDGAREIRTHIVFSTLNFEPRPTGTDLDIEGSVHRGAQPQQEEHHQRQPGGGGHHHMVTPGFLRRFRSELRVTFVRRWNDVCYLLQLGF